jgi:hypothetical protein
MLVLWHGFLFLGLRFFPLFFFLLVGLHCFFLYDFFTYLRTSLLLCIASQQQTHRIEIYIASQTGSTGTGILRVRCFIVDCNHYNL